MNSTSNSKPKIAYVNWSDQIGGAARSASRLLLEVNRRGEYQADFLVGHASRPTSSRVLPNGTTTLGRLRTQIDRLPLALYPQRFAVPWSVNWLPSPQSLSRRLRAYSVVHLHWVGSGALNPDLILQLSRPFIWTLHDLWPATGGCHIDYNCERLRFGCGACPSLSSHHEGDLSARSARRKRIAYKGSSITFVAPSRWMATRAQSAPALQGHKILVIRNGIDTRTYIPKNRADARRQFGFDPDSFLILFGAVNATSDPNKGYDLLIESLHHLGPRAQRGKAHLVIFGSNVVSAGHVDGISVTDLGHIADESVLATLYAACDVTVVPSRLESFGQVALESIACGTPVVCFGGSGLSEVIEHKGTGYVAQPYDVQDLAEGVLWWLNRADQVAATQAICSNAARDHFDIKGVAVDYSNAYAQLLEVAVKNASKGDR